MPRRFLFALLAFSFGALTLFGQTKPADKAGTGNIYKKSIKSVVWVFDKVSSTSARTGSGTLIDAKDRIILTNYHVVGDETTVFILFPIFDKNGAINNDRNAYIAKINDGTAPKGKVLAREAKRDLALIQIQGESLPKDTHAIRISKDGVGPADSVHCIGNSGISGGLFDYCAGAVRNVVPAKPVRPKGADFEINCKMVEHTAPTNRGQSGGPVLNDAGDLVAVTQGNVSAQNANSFSVAIELSEVKEFLKLNKYDRLNKAPAPTMASATETIKMEPTAPDPKEDARKRQSTAEFKLSFAKELIAAGKKDKARERLQDIIDNFADTKCVDEAKKLLETLK